MPNLKIQTIHMKKLLFPILVLIIAGIIYAFNQFIRPQLQVANGYAAKKMCSCTFIAGRDQESIQTDDLDIGPLGMTNTVIDNVSKRATTTFFGLVSRTAEYRGNLGCVLLVDGDDYDVNFVTNRPEVPADSLWPIGRSVSYDNVPDEVDLVGLKETVRNAFDASMNMEEKRTRAIVVVYKGQLLHELYANGFDQDTEILGWSMTKSITSTLVGIMVKNQLMSLEDKKLFSQWQDDRAEITLRDLLRQQSGLVFEENYGSVSDATRMLYISDQVSEIPMGKPLIHPIGTNWYYSSGTSNLVSQLLRNSMESDQAYWSLAYDSLFNKIGMSSAVLETDESGTFIGSSYTYATPRDWARFGQLYLNNGNWFGDQVIDSSWVDFVRTPAPGSDGKYGGHFWLNVEGVAMPDVPEDAYSCNGFQGQYVFVIPSYDLVVVRMGLSEQFDTNEFLKNILDNIRIAS